VTLHVHYDHDVGKTAMQEKDDEHFKKLTGYVSKKMGKHESVLFCVHKAVKPHIQAHKRKFKNLHVANWGAIDGVNDWSMCDKMAIYGLSYLKPVDPILCIMAFQEWRNQFREQKKVPELTKELKYFGSIYSRYRVVVNLVQAMNRVRCRRVIDDKGNCKKTDIYLFLNSEAAAEKLLDPVQRQMPRIKVKFLDDAPTAKVKKDRSPYFRKMIPAMATWPPGEYPVRLVQDDFGLSTRTMRRLISKIESGKGEVARDFKVIGVTYKPAMGRGAISCFVKAG
jgi:hypothetical protein